MIRRAGGLIGLLLLLLLPACSSAAVSQATSVESSNVGVDVAGADQGTECPDAPGPISGAIVFGADNELFAMEPDGGAVTRLTNVGPARWAVDPAWSPDGATLAYTLNAPGEEPDFMWLPASRICGMDRATGKGRVLASSEPGRTAVAEAAWLADGSGLLVTLYEHEFNQDNQYVRSATSIARFEPGAATGTPLIPDGTAAAPRPGGQEFVFVLIDPEFYDFVLMSADMDGQNARQLAEPDVPFGTMIAPRWSPDGAWLAFTASGGPMEEGSDVGEGRSWLEQLLGVRVASAHGPPANIWLVDAAGQRLRQLNDRLTDDPRVAWSPDGRSIAYVTGTGGIMLVDVATGEERQISTEGNYGGITWATR